MDEIDFQQWWDEFIENHSSEKEGFETVEHLRRYVRGLSTQKREAFLDELLRVATNTGTGASLALRILEVEAMPRHIQTICDHVTPLPPIGSVAEESILVAFLRVLAADHSAQCLHPVENYLLRRDIGLYWSSLPWSLWSHQPDLFCRAWARYFALTPSSHWRGTAVVQAFLSHPDAIARLKNELLTTSATAWNRLRDAIETAAHAPWLSKAQQASLYAKIVT